MCSPSARFDNGAGGVRPGIDKRAEESGEEWGTAAMQRATIGAHSSSLPGAIYDNRAHDVRPVPGKTPSAKLGNGRDRGLGRKSKPRNPNARRWQGGGPRQHGGAAAPGQKPPFSANQHSPPTVEVHSERESAHA